LGGFDTSYLLAGDFEFGLRLAADGVQFQHIPEVLSIFRSGGIGMSNLLQSNLESRRAVLAYRSKIYAIMQKALIQA
jgi:hypothetical protein